MKATKKTILSLATVLSVASVAIGVGALNKNTPVLASADTATMTVDTLGNLTWEAIDGATAYNVSYTIGSQSPVSFIAETNQANVGVALTKAAQTAVALNNADADTSNDVKASVVFSVSPQGVSNATPMTYTHEFDSYIDYGYDSHDFADVKASAKMPTKLPDLTLDGDMSRWIPSAMYKNDLLTMGVKTDVALHTRGIDMALFGPRTIADGGTNKYNFHIRLQETGRVSLSIKDTIDKYDYHFDAGDEYNTALEYGTPYYLSIAVFDTFDMSGNIAGETVYFTRSEYDATTDELVEVGGFSQFIDASTLETKGVTYTTISQLNANCQQMEVDCSAMRINAGGYTDAEKTDEIANHVYVFSGVPVYTALSAPDGLYYDNADATFNWNSVSGATEYEWRVGNEAWQTVEQRKVNVESLLTSYEELGYLPLSVRAKNGKTAQYNLDLERFYGARSVVTDFVDYATASSNLPNQVKRGESIRYLTGGKCFQETGVGYGKHVTIAFDILSESMSKRMVAIGLLGPKSSSNYNRYYLIVLGDGTVLISNYISQWNTSTRTKDKYWRATNIADGLLRGNRYYLTYGIDEVFEDDTKVADRVTVRLEQSENNGLDRRTVGIVRFDNTKFNTDGYALDTNDSIQFSSGEDECATYMAQGDTNYQIKFKVGNETLATKTVDYGAYYDFTDVENMPLTVPQGYEMDGWVYEENGKERAFDFFGTWNVIVEDGFEIKAKLTPITYSVSYGGVPCNNPTNYTVESTWALEKPATIENGYVFVGWYDASDINQTILTTLEGKVGNIELRAKFVRGFTITVMAGDTLQTIDFKQGDSPISLTAPQMEDREFVGWQIFDGDTYVAYNGNTVSLIPTADHKFKAIYSWKEYAITYVDNGATHENVATYTVNEDVRLSDATKEGYFFLGWYADENYTTKISNTNGQSGAITLYAKFIENSLPSVLEVERNKTAQELPVPKLQDGATYTVKVYAEEKELDVIDGKVIFDVAGEYSVQYAITLASGETLSHSVSVNVKEVYFINVHYGNGEMITLKKLAGEKLQDKDFPVKDGYQVEGVYVDSLYSEAYDTSKGLAEDLNVYVKWACVNTDAEVSEDEKGWVAPLLGAIGGVCVGVGATVAFVLCTRKKKKL